MNVLIVFGSAHGSTEGIARRIAARLEGRGVRTSLQAAGEATRGESTADAIIAGSAIHNGRWLPEAERFVLGLSAGFAGKPAWLFSVSSVGTTESFFPGPVAKVLRKLQKEPPPVPDLRRRFAVRGYTAFAGAVRTEDWGRMGTLFLRALGGHTGDHRNWPAVDAWADRIAEELGASLPRRPVSGRPGGAGAF